MLGVWICRAGWHPTVDNVRNLLRCILGVVGLVQQFAILPSSTVGDLVQVNSLAPELRQQLCHEYNSCDIPRWDHVNFATMSKLPKPEIVGLLIQESCQRQA